MPSFHVHVHTGKKKPTTKTAKKTADDWAKWNAEHMHGRHGATATLHHSIAKRKGPNHPDHPHHLAAAKHHEAAAAHAKAGKQAESEASHKLARAHENKINKGRGSDPQGEVKRQNAQMLDPKSKEHREAVAAFHAKHDKKKKAKDAAPCACKH